MVSVSPGLSPKEIQRVFASTIEGWCPFSTPFIKILKLDRRLTSFIPARHTVTMRVSGSFGFHRMVARSPALCVPLWTRIGIGHRDLPTPLALKKREAFGGMLQKKFPSLLPCGSIWGDSLTLNLRPLRVIFIQSEVQRGRDGYSHRQPMILIFTICKTDNGKRR